MRAEFSDRRARAALEQFVKRLTWVTLDTDELTAMVEGGIELCKAWPYRVLCVQPPYGNTGFDNYESALASS